MAGKKQTLANAMLNAVLRGGTYTGTATVYLGLCTAVPTATTSGTEVFGGSYTRMAITFSVAANGITSNVGPIVFPVATSPWGHIVGAVICNAQSGGSQLYFGNLVTSRTIDIGDQLTFNPGALSVTEA